MSLALTLSLALSLTLSPNPALPGGIFTNRFWNGSFYRRISPTSFYAMLAGAPTDQQVAHLLLRMLATTHAPTLVQSEHLVCCCDVRG